MIDNEIQLAIDRSNELLQQARTSYDVSNYPDAERCAQEVLSLLERHHERVDIGDERDNQSQKYALLDLIAHAYNRLSLIAFVPGDIPLMFEYAQTGIRYAERIGNLTRKARLLSNIGNAYVKIGKYSEALPLIEQTQSLYEELNDKNGIANCLATIGSLHLGRSEFTLALESYSRSLELYKEISDKQGVALVTGTIGNAHLYLSDFSQALEYYSKALQLEEQRGNIEGIATQIGNVAIVYSELKDFPRALEHYRKAISLYTEIGSKPGVATQLGNLGALYTLFGEYTQALDCFGQALDFDTEMGNKVGQALHLANLGQTHADLDDFDTALKYFERSLQVYEEMSQKSRVGYVKGMIGKLFADKNWSGHDEVRAEELLRESISISLELSTKHYKWHEVLAELYRGQERWREALEQVDLYHELKEQVHTEEATKSAAQMEQRRLVAEREKEIAISRAKADAEMNATTGLLHKVLPQSIATRLINGEKIADYFRDVSILFADIVGFTPIASRMPAKAVLAFLNYVFGEFDRMVTTCGCEKIKTIGDGYLAVAGAPESCDDHAERIARLAIEMTKDIILPDEIRKTLPKGAQFSLRIGIHTGPCFGGIVGENRFVYDIYSDAVNIAARMESHGEAGKIHVSDEFCFHLQNRMDATGEDLGGIRFEEREEMEIKGKGLMRTYFLERA